MIEACCRRLIAAFVGGAMGLASVPAAADPAPRLTTLSISASGSVKAVPDILAATLHAAGSGASAAAASAAVNAAMVAARRVAASAAAVTFSAGAYEVVQPAPPETRWQASQTVQVSGTDGPAVLTLVGQLQRLNLVTDDISWQLAAATGAALHQQAVQLALKALRTAAAQDAAAMGMHVDHFATISIDDAPGGMRPMAMMSMARGAGPQSDQPRDATIDATARAEIVLSP